MSSKDNNLVKQAHILEELTVSNFSAARVFECWKADPNNTIAVVRTLPWSKQAVLPPRLASLERKDINQHLQVQTLRAKLETIPYRSAQSSIDFSAMKFRNQLKQRRQMQSAKVHSYGPQVPEQTLSFRAPLQNKDLIISNFKQEQQQSLLSEQVHNQNELFKEEKNGGLFFKIKKLIKNINLKATLNCLIFLPDNKRN